MRVRIGGLLAVVGLLLGASQPASSDSPLSATIAEHRGQWDFAGGLAYYRVFGHVGNTSDQPLRYVEVEIELIAKDGSVVQRRSGYNQKAEVLGVPEMTGTREEKLQEIEPIQPGEQDLFRIALPKDELPANPKFTAYRIRIVYPPSGGSQEKLNINAASLDALLQLPEMTQARAKAIINYRTGQGDFIQLEELKLIPQVAPIYDQLKDRLILE